MMAALFPDGESLGDHQAAAVRASDRTPSPNLADAVMIAFNPSKREVETWLKVGVIV